MPRVLDINTADVQPTINQGSPFIHVNATPEMFGASIGEALERIGEQSMRASDRLAQNALDMSRLNTEAVARDAFNKASESYRVKSVTDGIYSKKPAQLYGDGQTPVDVYSQAKKEFEASGNEFAQQITNPRAQLLFQKAWGEHGNTELGRAANYAGTAHREYIGQTLKDFMAGHDERVSGLATNVEQNWRNLDGASAAAATDLKAGLRLGVPVDEVTKAARKASDSLNSAAIRGWFNEQPDLDKAAEQLALGKTDNPDVQKILDKIDPKVRESLYTHLLEDRHKLAVIHNADRVDQERREKEAATGAVSNFFFKPNQPVADLQQQFDALAGNVHVPLETKQKMQEFIRNGGHDTGTDVEADEFDVERAIRADKLPTDTSIMNYIYENGLQVSVNTARTRLLPLLQAQSDKHFDTVISWGENELGYDKSAAASGLIKLTSDKVDKAAKFRAEMLALRQAKPDMDVWSEGRRIVDGLKKQGDQSALTSIPIMAQKYRDALGGKDLKEKANAKFALTMALKDAGIVDPLTAARSDFDPLAIIDTPAKPTNARTTP